MAYLIYEQVLWVPLAGSYEIETMNQYHTV